MPGRKFNYYKFGAFCLIVLAILFGIIYGISTLISNAKYKKTDEYKFITMGYTLEEYKVIENKLDKTKINKLLTMKYNEYIDDFLNEKYFLFKNLNKYLDYKKDNTKEKNATIVKIINTESNVEWIDTEKQTDIEDKDLMLVNRLYGLTKEYEPEYLVSIPLKYAYSGKKISNAILPNIYELISAGEEQNYTFVVSAGYRSYEEQEKIYNSYVESYGKSEADKTVARPGHSEYQTGISFDIQPYNKVFENSFESEEYKWLSKNAYKYGFILRFPKGEESITGFNASAWRLRYVGEDVASKIYNDNITYEEYYAYYVVGDK